MHLWNSLLQGYYCSSGWHDTICQAVTGRHGAKIHTGTIFGVWIAYKHHGTRIGAWAHCLNAGREGGTPDQVQAQREPAHAYPSEWSSC